VRPISQSAWVRNDVASDWKHQGRVLRNRYQLSDRFVRGALCCVYRGEDTVLRRSIVVKAVPPEHIASFRAALRDTAALTHPAVVATYDAVEEDHYLFIVQEYVPARPLSAYLRDGIPSERALDLAAQIARALAYAHAHDVAHGDLTPSAVLIDRQASVRINNFGLPPDREYFARMAVALEPSAAQAEDASAGTGFTEEEQAGQGSSGLREPTSVREDDVRSVGLLLWQVLSESASLPLAELKTARQERAFRPDVPPPVRELVERCVVRSHPDRLVDAERLALAIEALEAELAAHHPAVSEHTPPALRLARDEAARAAPWSVQRTVGSLRPWNAEGEREVSRRPIATAGRDRVQPGPWREVDTPVVAGPPRIQLPSRPIRDDVGAIRATAAPRARAGAALELGKPARWPAESEPSSPPGTISWTLVLLLGMILFLVFFLVGFFGPRILG
jgi:serine/threonine-protein kinase